MLCSIYRGDAASTVLDDLLCLVGCRLAGKAARRQAITTNATACGVTAARDEPVDSLRSAGPCSALRTAPVHDLPVSFLYKSRCAVCAAPRSDLAVAPDRGS